MPAQAGPGLSTPIVAGESYVLKDDAGAELHLEGRDDPLVVEFLAAFDYYLQLLKADSGAGEQMQQMIWTRLVSHFERLPRRLREEVEYRRVRRSLQ